MSGNSNPFEKKTEGVFFFKSSNPYEFYDFLNDKNMDDKQDVWGTLIFPQNAKKPCPLIIPIHGSAGLREGHHTHMVNLLEAGFAVFRIHHFESRGVISIVENQTAVTLATMITDAFRALSMLTLHPGIDSSKIGIMGWSLGGSTCLLYTSPSPRDRTRSRMPSSA